MRYICTRCFRTSVDGNLWCQEKYCPAEESPEILDHGDWIGDMEIVNMLTVTRTFSLYEARRGEKQIILKIAHPGMQEKLKREARLLVDLSKKRQHPMLPRLLPAFEGASLKDLPYGKTIYAGKTRYYEIFEYSDGETLRAMLLKNPTPYFQIVGWIILGLSDAIAFLHQSGRLHFCLSPEVVFVRFDKQGIPRPILIDLGIADGAQNLTQEWDRHFIPAAYTAPEIVEMKGKVGPGTDIYGLGMILYEMLAGHPAYEYQQARDQDVYLDLLHHDPPPTGRADLIKIPEIAERAILKDYNARYTDVFSFAKELQANLPRLPVEKKPFHINWRVMAIVTGTALAVSLLLTLAVLIQG